MQYIFRILMILLIFSSFAAQAQADTEADSAEPQFDSDVWKHPYTSYKAENKILFYKHCSQDSSALCPTGAYIIKGDYFIARQTDENGYFYAAYFPKKSVEPSAEGYIKNENFTAVKLEDYGLPSGRWRLVIDDSAQRTVSFSLTKGGFPYDSETSHWTLKGMEEHRNGGSPFNSMFIISGPVLKISDKSFAVFSRYSGDNGLNDPVQPYVLFFNGNELLITADSSDNAYFTGEYFSVNPCYRAQDLLKDENARSYKAAGKIPFYKSCPAGDESLCPTGSYIIKGDYFIAIRRQDGNYCAAYIPDGFDKPKALGYIKPENFAETDKTEYQSLLGTWISPSLAVGFFNQGNDVLMEGADGMDHALGYYTLYNKALKAGGNSFVAATDFGLYNLYLHGGNLTLSNYKGSAVDPKDSDANVTNMHEGDYRLMDSCSDAAALIREFNIRSYKAEGKIPFFKPCPQDKGTLCPTGSYIVKGDYFIAVPAPGGNYCAAYIPETYKKPKAIGLIHADNFSETKPEEYQELSLKGGMTWSRAGKNDDFPMAVSPGILYYGNARDLVTYGSGIFLKTAPHSFIGTGTEYCRCGEGKVDFHPIYDIHLIDGKLHVTGGDVDIGDNKALYLGTYSPVKCYKQGIKFCSY